MPCKNRHFVPSCVHILFKIYFFVKSKHSPWFSWVCRYIAPNTTVSVNVSYFVFQGILYLKMYNIVKKPREPTNEKIVNLKFVYKGTYMFIMVKLALISIKSTWKNIFQAKKNFFEKNPTFSESSTSLPVFHFQICALEKPPFCAF